MDTIGIADRISMAIGKCSEMQKSTVTQWHEAEERTAAAKQAYKACHVLQTGNFAALMQQQEAEAHSNDMEKTCRADLVTIQTRQSLLSHVISEGGVNAIEAALQPIALTNGTLSLVGSGSKSRSQTAITGGKNKPSAGEIKLSKPSYVNDPGYIEECSVIVPYQDGYVEVRCQECETNCDPARKTFMKGASGVQKHLARQHGIKIDVAQALKRSIHRTLDVDQVRSILAGETVVKKMDKGKIISTAGQSKGTAASLAGSSQGKRKVDSMLSATAREESEDELGMEGITKEEARARMRRALSSFKYEPSTG